MRNLVREYRALSFERKTVIKTVVGLCGSAVLALGKLTIGLLTDFNLVSIAVYTFAILLAKLECLWGIRSNKRSFETRNRLVAVFLLFASLVYIGFMSRMFFMERTLRDNGMLYVLLLAFISFLELGFGIAGVLRTKTRGSYYRNIKLINLCVAVIAILTTQMAILNMESETGKVSILNAYSGIGVGVFIALVAVYILLAPKWSVLSREHNAFVLAEAEKNRLEIGERGEISITLCKSAVYGDYVYRAILQGDTADGNICRTPSLWKRMHVVWKVLCCILSEILLFVWLGGRMVLFFRSLDLPSRLEKIMRENGFSRTLCGEKTAASGAVISSGA